ncbi:MAG: hypothetical protein H7X95_08360 [Deltaproteobacteria bacterium]|nr:hypothetical protein [Deltaproteobacteria bacterium]
MFVAAVVFCSMSLATTIGAIAGPIKTYQVTGPILEVTDTTITIEKDKEKWQIARDKETKVNGDIKVGSRVTIQYRMSATTIDVKAETKTDPKTEGDTKAAKEKPAKK